MGLESPCDWPFEVQRPKPNLSSGTNQASWRKAPILSFVICKMGFCQDKGNVFEALSSYPWLETLRGLSEVQETTRREEGTIVMDREMVIETWRDVIIDRACQYPGEGENQRRPGTHTCLARCQLGRLRTVTVVGFGMVAVNLPKMASGNCGFVRAPCSGGKR